MIVFTKGPSNYIYMSIFIFNFQTEIVTFYPKHIIIQWIYGLIGGMSRHHRLSLMNYNIV